MKKILLIFCAYILLAGCQSDSQSQKMNTSKKTPTEKKTNETPRKKTKKVEPKAPTKIVPTKPKGSNNSKLKSKIDKDNIDLDLLTSALHNEINKARQNNGLKALKVDHVLTKAANNQNRYQLTIEDLSHTQTTVGKKTLSDRVSFYGGGFQLIGENLIYEGFTVRTINGTRREIITPTYQKMASTLVKNWLNSPPHRKNILQAEFAQVGTAVHYNPDNFAIYATQVFGKRY